MNKRKKVVLGILIVLTIILLVSLGVLTDFIKLTKIKVTDFESCAKANGVVMESYPRQCIYEGQNYVEEIPGQNLTDDIEFEDEKTNTQMKEAMQLPDKDRTAIEKWIKDNKLNNYGDPKDSVYAGGNPLFDESTGKYQKLYDYLVMMHPDKPWVVSFNPVDKPKTDDESVSNNTPDTSVIGFTQVKQWDRYTDPYFYLDYPSTDENSGNPFETSISKENGYPVKIYNSDGLDFSIFISTAKPSTYEVCDEKSAIYNDKKVFLCHNKSSRYQEIYTRMKDSFSIN
jgi:hypothetical protein